MAKGAGPRHAAVKKNEPYRDTEKYAIYLYEEKEWNSAQNGVDQIQSKVVAYGKTVGVHWTTDYQANKLIYKWILGHIKNSK
jgi:hypothetical protein